MNGIAVGDFGGRNTFTVNENSGNVRVTNKANGNALFVEAKIGIFFVADVTEIPGIDEIGVGDDEVSQH